MTQGEFPATVQKVYILPPSSFLQKKFADNSLKFLKDDVKFKVLNMSGFCYFLHKLDLLRCWKIFLALDKSTKHNRLRCMKMTHILPQDEFELKMCQNEFAAGAQPRTSEEELTVFFGLWLDFGLKWAKRSVREKEKARQGRGRSTLKQNFWLRLWWEQFSCSWPGKSRDIIPVTGTSEND